MENTGWLLDPTRNEWYYFNAQEGCYVYQSGRRIFLSPPQGSNTGQERGSIHDPRSRPSRRDVEQAEEGEEDDSDDDDEEEEEDDDDDDDEPDEGHPREAQTYKVGKSLSSEFARMKLGNKSTKSTSSIETTHSQPVIYPDRPGSLNPDEILWHMGLRVTDRLYGSQSKGGHGCKVRKGDAHTFFKPGRVFRVNWPEPPKKSKRKKEKDGNVKRVTLAVVRSGPQYSTCVRITTNNGQGVEMEVSNRRNYAIAYSSETAPTPTREEASDPFDKMMEPPIRIVVKKSDDRLHPMSRIDFSPIFTIDHDAKVHNIGKVHGKSMGDFKNHWFQTVIRNLRPEGADNVFGLPNAFNDTDDEDDDDDDEEEESSESEEYPPQPPQYVASSTREATWPEYDRSSGAGGTGTSSRKERERSGRKRHG